MARGIVAGLAARGAESLADPVARLAEILIRDQIFRLAVQEALIVLALSAGLFGCAWAGAQLGDPEPAVIAACTLVSVYMLHFAVGGARKLPWIRRTVALRLGPRGLLRAGLYLVILAELRRLNGMFRNGGLSWPQGLMLDLADRFFGEADDAAAYRATRALMPRLWAICVRAFVLWLAPLLLAIAVFRQTVTYGPLLNGAAHIGFIEAVFYPVAAVADLLFGTDFRMALRGG